jgi:hypothetical protein
MSATMLSFTKTIDETTIHMAMTDVVLAFVDEFPVPFDADNELAAAARTPVSMAATLGDLCALLGIRPPTFVRLALT